METVVQETLRAGLGHHRAGRLAEAEKNYRKVLEADPQNAEALHLLGLAAYHGNRPERAIELISDALINDPGNVKYIVNLGGAYQASGNTDDAARCYRQAMEHDPESADAFYNLGLIMLAEGNLEDTLNSFQRAVSIDPDFAEAHYNLGLTLAKTDDPARAEAAYRRAIKINPDFALALNNLASLVKARHETDEAEAIYRRALKIEPDNFRFHYNLANLFLEEGRREEAVTHFHRTVALNPAFAEAHRQLASVKTFTDHDADIRSMEALLPRLPDDGMDQIQLSFALGKAYDDLADHDQAFAHYQRGNRVKRSSLEYDHTDDQDLARRIASVFSESFLSENAGHGFPADTPVFVLGMPRSGTTLIEQIMASHSGVHGGGELNNLTEQAGALKDGGGFPNSLTTQSAADFRQMGRAYVEDVLRLDPAATRIVDKMPANFLYIGLIHLILPGARIIHCRRDAVDTCLSCYMQLFKGSSQGFSYDLVELGRYYRLYSDLMDHWGSVLPGRFLDVCYEDVVADPEREARKIIEFCGLEWEDACLDFYNTKRSVRTASSTQVRNPIYKGSVKRWRHYRSHLGPLLETLGSSHAAPDD